MTGDQIVRSYSLDCKEGHMKKNSLCVCVCLFASGSKKHFFRKTRKYHFFTVPWLGDGQPCYYVYHQLTANVRVVVWSHGHYLTYSVLLRNQSFEFLLRRATLAIVCSRLATFHICVSFLHKHLD